MCADAPAVPPVPARAAARPVHDLHDYNVTAVQLGDLYRGIPVQRAGARTNFEQHPMFGRGTLASRAWARSATCPVARPRWRGGAWSRGVGCTGKSLAKHEIERIVRTLILHDIIEERPAQGPSGFVVGYVAVRAL